MVLAIFRDVKNDKENNVFSIVHHNYGTRGNDLDLMCPQPRTTLYKYSMHCVGPMYWNSLPTDIKILENINTFKNKLKVYYINQQRQT